MQKQETKNVLQLVNKIRQTMCDKQVFSASQKSYLLNTASQLNQLEIPLQNCYSIQNKHLFTRSRRVVSQMFCFNNSIFVNNIKDLQSENKYKSYKVVRTCTTKQFKARFSTVKKHIFCTRYNRSNNVTKINCLKYKFYAQKVLFYKQKQQLFRFKKVTPAISFFLLQKRKKKRLARQEKRFYEQQLHRKIPLVEKQQPTTYLQQQLMGMHTTVFCNCALKSRKKSGTLQKKNSFSKDKMQLVFTLENNKNTKNMVVWHKQSLCESLKLIFTNSPDFYKSKTNILPVSNKKFISQNKLLISLSGGQDSTLVLFFLQLLQKQFAFLFVLLWCNHFWQIDSFYTTLHIAKVSFCFSSPLISFIPLNSVLSEHTARDWRHLTTDRASIFYEHNLCVHGHTKSDRVETILFNLIRGTKLLTCLQWERQHSSFSYNNMYPTIKQLFKETYINY